MHVAARHPPAFFCLVKHEGKCVLALLNEPFEQSCTPHEPKADFDEIRRTDPLERDVL